MGKKKKLSHTVKKTVSPIILHQLLRIFFPFRNIQ